MIYILLKQIFDINLNLIVLLYKDIVRMCKLIYVTIQNDSLIIKFITFYYIYLNLNFI